MLRLAIAFGAVLAIAAPASAEMAAPRKPSKQTVIKGCTSVGVNGCVFVGGAMLTADPGVVIPPAKTYIVAKGKMTTGPDLCFAGKQFHAKSIIATKRRCK
jgi:hypothetical protein